MVGTSNRWIWTLAALLLAFSCTREMPMDEPAASLGEYDPVVRFGLETYMGPDNATKTTYAGDDQNPQANMKKILAEMKEKTDRHARFRTVIALIEKGEERLFEGRVDGIITTEARGDQGFGYDPVFSPEGTGQTFAEMGEQAKNRISHRARAVQKLLQYINNQS